MVMFSAEVMSFERDKLAPLAIMVAPAVVPRALLWVMLTTP